jgi:hypothetical protein
MADGYLVELKDSVFRETPLEEADFDNRQLTFRSEGDAAAWVSEQNRSHSRTGNLTLHTAHPDDNSGVDAYVVFRSSGVWVVDSDE